MTALFRDRQDAGKKLAKRLLQYRDSSPILLTLPRGGVVVGNEVAHALAAPLDVVIARKLEAPNYEGLSFGAIAEGGVRIIDSLALRMLNISETRLAEIEASAQADLAKYLNLYRPGRPFLDVKDRTVILVDDGLASGLTARAAMEVITRKKPRKIILASPISGPDIAAAMLNWVDDFICYATPPDFLFAGDWYEEFDHCPEETVVKILTERAAQ